MSIPPKLRRSEGGLHLFNPSLKSSQYPNKSFILSSTVTLWFNTLESPRVEFGDMAYTINPKLSVVRMLAVRLVKYRGWSTRKVARHTGFSQSAVVKWCAKDPTGGWRQIPTESSRPHSHARQLTPNLVDAIVAQRHKNGRCAEVVHQELLNQGIRISLSSVKRTLDRNHLLVKRSPYKRWHVSLPRPLAEKSGDLVQVDTIHVMLNQRQRFYVYALIDIYSRWGYAWVSERINTWKSMQFVKLAQRKAGFKFMTIQTDNGSEFSTYFSENIKTVHRHSRVRRPNDNGHVERFIRTLQEECLNKVLSTPADYQGALNNYLPYYNQERLHLGINLLTPIQLIPSY